RRRHPQRLRLISRVLGLDDLRSDAAIREFVRDRPFVALRPECVPEPDPDGGPSIAEPMT
ncbi:MAG TPA: hypothetical protein VIR15_00550, partial [Intrasporangium sp.]|uniref:hypothetical protein n=1 Tax=Intrasporangium sp. TaxID=1925024 RepID=UPI002F920EFD